MLTNRSSLFSTNSSRTVALLISLTLQLLSSTLTIQRSRVVLGVSGLRKSNHSLSFQISLHISRKISRNRKLFTSWLRAIMILTSQWRRNRLKYWTRSTRKCTANTSTTFTKSSTRCSVNTQTAIFALSAFKMEHTQSSLTDWVSSLERRRGRGLVNHLWFQRKMMTKMNLNPPSPAQLKNLRKKDQPKRKVLATVVAAQLGTLQSTFNPKKLRTTRSPWLLVS